MKLELAGNDTLPYQELLDLDLPQEFKQQVPDLMRYATRQARQAEAADSRIEGSIKFNDEWVNTCRWSTWEAMDTEIRVKFGEDFTLEDLLMNGIQCPGPALNDFLDYAIEKISTETGGGLRKIDFSSWP